jgi:acetyl-CoA carboxylase biotin carboxyl carrier protein
MSRRDSNYLRRERSGKVRGSELPTTSLTVRVEKLDELLNRVRCHVVRLLSGVPRPPSALRVQADEVSLDIEWSSEHLGTAPDGAELAMASLTEIATEADADTYYLISPAVGVFYRAPGSDAAPFVSKGDTVMVGQQVGIIESMKLMIPVEADVTGRVVEVLKNNGEPVEYGERLFAFAAVEPT